MLTVTTIEYLPTEIWLDIFRYMWLREVRQSFASLNKRIDTMMKSSHLHWHADVRGRESLSDMFGKNDIRLDRIVSLRLSKRLTSKQTQFLTKNVSRFVHLRTLVLSKSHTRSIRQTIASVGHQLVDLSITCVLSNELIQQILTLPFLRRCSLSLNGVSSNFLLVFEQYSSTIERFTILSDMISCKVINSLVLCLPRLRRLHLAENQRYIMQPKLDDKISILFSQLSHLHLKLLPTHLEDVHRILRFVQPWPSIFSLDISYKDCYISELSIIQWFHLCTTAIDTSNHCQISIQLCGSLLSNASAKLNQCFHPLIVIEREKYGCSSDELIRMNGTKGSIEKFYC